MRYFVLLLAAGFASTTEAQVKLDRLYPPAVPIGSPTSIQAEGEFPNWPVSVECDRPDVDVKLSEKSGVLEVTVAKGSQPGVAWLRMHENGSATGLVPLLIETLPVAAEKEPNQEIAEATPLDLPTGAVGRLQKSGDVDVYRVTLAAGEQVVCEVTAHRLLRSPMDSVLQLTDARGNVLRQADDVCGLDPRIVYRADRDGDYFFRIFAFPETPTGTIGFAGTGTFVYQMRVTTGPRLDHVLPLLEAAGARHGFGWNLNDHWEVQSVAASGFSPPLSRLVAKGTAPTDAAVGWHWHPTIAASGSVTSLIDDELDPEGSSGPHALPLLLSGHISAPGETDVIRFATKKGKKVRATVHSRRFGFPLDSLLRLVDPGDGSEIARNDDRGRNEFDAKLDFTPKKDGEVELQISDLVDGFGITHAYTLVVEEVAPSVTLSVDADRYQCVAGEAKEITIDVNRQDGFDRPLDFKVLGLPDGIEVAAPVSEPKGDSAKKVPFTLTAPKDMQFQGNIRIVAQVPGEDGKPVGEELTVRHALRDAFPLTSIWLTVAPRQK